MEIFITVLVIAVVWFYIWGFVNVITNKAVEQTPKILWIISFLLFGILGTIVYYFARPSETPVEDDK